MKRTRIIGMVSGLALALMTWMGGASRTQSQQASPTAVPQALKEPSTQEINDAFVQQISKQIVGHEQEPSGQVFKNIQVNFLKKVPAARLLLIMNEDIAAPWESPANTATWRMTSPRTTNAPSAALAIWR